jgi:hypothetical protein
MGTLHRRNFDHRKRRLDGIQPLEARQVIRADRKIEHCNHAGLFLKCDWLNYTRIIAQGLAARRRILSGLGRPANEWLVYLPGIV